MLLLERSITRIDLDLSPWRSQAKGEIDRSPDKAQRGQDCNERSISGVARTVMMETQGRVMRLDGEAQAGLSELWCRSPGGVTRAVMGKPSA